MKKKFLIKIKMHFCENYSTIEPHFSYIDMHKKAMYRGSPPYAFFWDLEKTVLHETRVSGTVLWSPTNANSPTYTYISQKTC